MAQFPHYVAECYLCAAHRLPQADNFHENGNGNGHPQNGGANGFPQNGEGNGYHQNGIANGHHDPWHVNGHQEQLHVNGHHVHWNLNGYQIDENHQNGHQENEDLNGHPANVFVNGHQEDHQANQHVNVPPEGLQFNALQLEIDYLQDYYSNPLAIQPIGEPLNEPLEMQENGPPEGLQELLLHIDDADVDVTRELHYTILAYKQLSLTKTLITSGAMPTVLCCDCIYNSHPVIEDMDHMVILATPFMLSFMIDTEDIAELFASLCFLNLEDLYFDRECMETLSERLGVPMALDTFTDRYYGSPWSLQTLSFVHISTRLGFGSDRWEKIASLPIPEKFQKALRFEIRENQEEEGVSFL